MIVTMECGVCKEQFLEEGADQVSLSNRAFERKLRHEAKAHPDWMKIGGSDWIRKPL